MSKLWGGRFTGGLDPRFESFNRSLAVDSRMWREDIRGSIAWAKALLAAQVLDSAEERAIREGLERLAARLEEQPGAFSASQAEDVHSYVEGELKSDIGEPARKLHTGRSRNDQVATDLRLYLKRRAAALEERLVDLQRALVELAEPHAADPMPGFTHLQRAQPVTIGHHLLAYAEMLERDRTRIQDAVARMDRCPLGSGALAGTAFPVDREALARDLGFAGATSNSLDSVASRDHASEIAFACSTVAVHLSRLSEDWIFFASQESRLLELSDAVATGSSLMPQKKNPDSLELLRGKTARVLGALQSLLVLQKGLPLAYDKDLQEDKELLFDALDTVEGCLEVAAITVRSARFDTQRCRAESTRGYANATDLADWLVRRGIPFRDAHERAGAVVRTALEARCEIEELPAPAWRAQLPELADVTQEQWRAELCADAVLERRNQVGGTSPSRVRTEILEWKRRLEAWKTASRA
ncbi:MAG: argininosuccinate lyase [Planctomycetes bacterium]|nr:argininosuccinate lyase [Planctomycetota bacterium]